MDKIWYFASFRIIYEEQESCFLKNETRKIKWVPKMEKNNKYPLTFNHKNPCRIFDNWLFPTLGLIHLNLSIV